MPSAEFFDAVRRPLFGGRLRQSQVDGLNQIVTYGIEHGYSRYETAYNLATAHHETGRRMQPIREGFASTDAGARRAVAGLFAKGIIRTNYALPAGPYRLSYYGRGLIQITWADNYERMSEVVGVDLLADPDATLRWEVALPLMFVGMRNGMYTGKKLPRSGNGFPSSLRAIVNGDVRKNGARVSGYARTYFNALETSYG